MKKTISVLLAITLTICILVSCSPASGSGNSTAASGGQVTVNFLNWGDYIDPTVIPLFEEENPDVKINMTTAPSNEEMYVSASTEGTQIDVVLPSEYMIQRMMQENMLAELDTSSMENYQYVKEFAQANCGYDPNCTYSMPYSWGTFGIIYNTEIVTEEEIGWDILFDEKYKGQILMYDSIRDSLGVALIELGYSLNSRDEAEISAAGSLLVDQKPLVLAYGTDDLRMTMSSSDAAIPNSAAMAVMYAGDAVYTMQDNDKLEYVIPQEGANIFVDALCILETSDVKEEAQRFIDFMMRPDIAALNAEYTGYSTPEDAALEYIDEEILQNYAFNPDKEDLVNCEYYEHLDQEVLKLYEAAWMQVKMA
ncbi:ABC transporter substrate-binding protein [Christensenellaceae bacterium OttesenSCG-928-K19]|nr:ABC transporter substrate-binding protein [Christensenellaceae bacterium OttesenSCG-928-K19]